MFWYYHILFSLCCISIYYKFIFSLTCFVSNLLIYLFSIYLLLFDRFIFVFVNTFLDVCECVSVCEWVFISMCVIILFIFMRFTKVESYYLTQFNFNVSMFQFQMCKWKFDSFFSSFVKIEFTNIPAIR